jgi:hypothetical protein
VGGHAAGSGEEANWEHHHHPPHTEQQRREGYHLVQQRTGTRGTNQMYWNGDDTTSSLGVAVQGTFYNDINLGGNIIRTLSTNVNISAKYDYGTLSLDYDATTRPNGIAKGILGFCSMKAIDQTSTAQANLMKFYYFGGKADAAPTGFGLSAPTSEPSYGTVTCTGTVNGSGRTVLVGTLTIESQHGRN